MTKQVLLKRFYQHKSDSKLNRTSSPIHNAIRKYGINNFDIILIQEFSEKQKCVEKEKELISKNINGYNVAPGGEGGFVVTNIESWKAKLRVAREGRKPALNMKHTEKSKNYFSEVSKKYWETQDTYDWKEIEHLTHKEAKLKTGISTTHYYRLKKQFSSNEAK